MRKETIEDAVLIKVDDQQLAGTFVTAPTRLPGVLFVHGWGGCQQQYLARAQAVAALGCVCLTFNLRGHVETRPLFETVSREINLRDVLSAYDRLAGHRHVDPNEMAVVGSSYGGYLASILTTLRPVQWLALRAPALYVDEGWAVPKLQLHERHDLRAYRSGPVAASDNRALGACHAFRGDVLLIESEHDTIVPQAVLSSYREACVHARSLTYRCIAQADHGLSDEVHQRAYTKRLVDWLSEMHVRNPEAGVSPPTEPHAVVLPETPPQAIAVDG